MARRGEMAFDRVAHEYDETRGGTARATSAARVPTWRPAAASAAPT